MNVAYATRTLPRSLHHVLPSNATVLEQSLVYAYDAQRLPVLIEQINDADKVDVRLLSAVAYGLGVDYWSSDWSESVRRTVLKTTRDIQAHKGTMWAIREVLKAVGQGGAEIIERVQRRRYGDGSHFGEGLMYSGAANQAGTFAIRLKQPVTEAHGRLIIDAVSAVKPTARHLLYIDWARNNLRWGSGLRWGGGFTWGLIKA